MPDSARSACQELCVDQYNPPRNTGCDTHLTLRYRSACNLSSEVEQRMIAHRPAE
jgi:hypothetical protein